MMNRIIVYLPLFSLLLSLIALSLSMLVLARDTGRKQFAVRIAADAVRLKNCRNKWQEAQTRLKAQHLRDEAELAETARRTLETMATPEAAPAQSVDESLMSLRNLLAKVQEWLNVTGTPADGLRGLESLEGYARDGETLRASDLEIVKVGVETVLVQIVSKTDVDLADLPAWEKQAIEAAVQAAMQAAYVNVIAPAPGTLRDPNLHGTLRVTPGRPEQQGRVAAVMRRGLRWRTGEVIQKAEIDEFKTY